MPSSLRFMLVCGLILGALVFGGCAKDSGTLGWNPFSGGGSNNSGGCGPGCNH